MHVRLAGLLLVPLLLLTGCSDDGDEAPVSAPDISGSLISVEGCKTFARSGEGNDRSCVRFTYDAEKQTLQIVHVNAGFNCCPERIDATVTVKDGVILVTESEIGPNCRCDCLFDLDILIEHVPVAAYRVRIEEPYRSPDEAELDFPIDLAKESSGEHCVPRNVYPWGS